MPIIPRKNAEYTDYADADYSAGKCRLCQICRLFPGKMPIMPNMPIIPRENAEYADYAEGKCPAVGLVRSFFQPANRNLVGLPSLLSLSSQRGICPTENKKKSKIVIFTNLLLRRKKVQKQKIKVLINLHCDLKV